MTLLLLAVCGRGESARPEPRGDSVADAVAAASYARSSIFDGLPAEFLPQVEQIMDNRLSSSSWQSSGCIGRPSLVRRGSTATRWRRRTPRSGPRVFRSPRSRPFTVCAYRYFTEFGIAAEAWLPAGLALQ